jgi:hypothetical protein
MYHHVSHPTTTNVGEHITVLHNLILNVPSTAGMQRGFLQDIENSNLMVRLVATSLRFGGGYPLLCSLTTNYVCCIFLLVFSMGCQEEKYQGETF